MKAYLDNAATTPIDASVVAEMIPVLQNSFGNPSSTHAYGREVKGLLEQARRRVAKHVGAIPSEIIFTSGGTEADNMAITSAVRDLGVKRIITSRIEHHAVGHTVASIQEQYGVQVAFVNLEPDGCVDLNHLEELLAEDVSTLVSLMHANNEVGNLIPLEHVGKMCRDHGAYFHSDTVQTMGHYEFDLTSWKIDFATCAAHKFHGPKGAGFLYVNRDLNISPLIQGGAQERNMRGGTENIYGIVGLAKAMDLAYEGLEQHQKDVQGLKDYMMDRLVSSLPGVVFNGACANSDKSLYTVLNVQLPATDKASMLLFNLDIMGVACSGGSACSSGSNQGSHVLKGIQADQSRPSVRFSFGRFTTREEVDFAVACLVEIYKS